ncbi:MAG: HAD family hydrolase [Ruminococcaceae bacterium]|nr:HAD family hydrolase [Oscillospiraceae bacterium]
MYYLFDMDGVLFNSEPVTVRAAQAVLLEYGVRAEPEDFIPFIGAGDGHFVGGVAEKYGVAYVPDMKDKLYENYLVLVKEGLQICPGAKEILTLLKKRGEKIALCSSADFIKIKGNTDAAELPLEIFDALICGDDVELKKPHPDVFLAAANQLGANAKDCLVIEDAVNGIQAAKNAGMRCAAITSSFSREVLLAEEPDFIINNLMEIADLPM